MGEYVTVPGQELGMVLTLALFVAWKGARLGEGDAGRNVEETYADDPFC